VPLLQFLAVAAGAGERQRGLNAKCKMQIAKLYLFTAENAESAEMTNKERLLNQITEGIIGAAIER